jgi:uncharacterized membrane protein YgcG
VGMATPCAVRTDVTRGSRLLARVRDLEPSLDASERERLTQALASADDLEAVLLAD